MKALYVYSNKTGLKRSYKKDKRIINKLSKIFTDLKSVQTSSIEEFSSAIKDGVDNYEAIVVCGGDGTLKLAVNELLKYPKDKRPILGYLPGGTVNDAGKAFGCGNTIEKGMRNLKKQKVTYVDVMKANDQYLNFCAAIGAYSDISYSTKRKAKSIIGRIAYYFDAIPEAFKKYELDVNIEIDDEKYNFKSPFLMVMNSRNIGGFPVNFKSKVNDGYIELFVTKPGIFNGILHYLFNKRKIIKIRAQKLKISTNSRGFWCFDGEIGTNGDLEISVLKQELKVFGEVK